MKLTKEDFCRFAIESEIFAVFNAIICRINEKKEPKDELHPLDKEVMVAITQMKRDYDSEVWEEV